MIRLLICDTCGSIEELPDYEGPPERDDTLNFKVAPHKFPDGNEHFGKLAKVDEASWRKSAHRHEIIKKISVTFPGQSEGLGQTYYDVKSTFQEDAMRCWEKEHGSRTNCEDYMSDKKRLIPDTKADRRAEGVQTEVMPNTWLCQFCPVESIVMQRKRAAGGDYHYTG